MFELTRLKAFAVSSMKIEPFQFMLVLMLTIVPEHRHFTLHNFCTEEILVHILKYVTISWNFFVNRYDVQDEYLKYKCLCLYRYYILLLLVYINYNTCGIVKWILKYLVNPLIDTLTYLCCTMSLEKNKLASYCS